MSDLIADLTSKKSAGKCAFAVLLENLQDEERTTVLGVAQEILDANSRGFSLAGKSFRWLAVTLTKHGHKISDNSIGRHVKGICHCD